LECGGQGNPAFSPNRGHLGSVEVPPTAYVLGREE
jgi:hypothetical protein